MTQTSAWQPIETAPKNGTTIRLKHKELGNFKAKFGKVENWSASECPITGRKWKPEFLGHIDKWLVWNWQGFGNSWIGVDESAAFVGWKEISQ